MNEVWERRGACRWIAVMLEKCSKKLSLSSWIILRFWYRVRSCGTRIKTFWTAMVFTTKANGPKNQFERYRGLEILGCCPWAVFDDYFEDSGKGKKGKNGKERKKKGGCLEVGCRSCWDVCLGIYVFMPNRKKRMKGVQRWCISPRIDVSPHVSKKGKRLGNRKVLERSTKLEFGCENSACVSGVCLIPWGIISVQPAILASRRSQ